MLHSRSWELIALLGKSSSSRVLWSLAPKEESLRVRVEREIGKAGGKQLLGNLILKEREME